MRTTELHSQTPSPLTISPLTDEFTRSISVHGYLAGDVAGCIETLEFSQLHNIKPIVTKFPMSKAAEAYDSVAKAQGRVVLVA